MAISKSVTAHIALIVCNVIWACDFPFYTLILGKYVSPLAMVSASLVVAALLSLLPLLWEPAERVAPSDKLKIVGAAMLIGIARKLCMMFGLAETSSIDGSLISTATPLLVLLLSVSLGVESFTKIKGIGLLLGMGGTIAIIISSNSSAHEVSSLKGNTLIFISACVSAAYMVFFKHLSGRYRATTILRWIYCSSAIVMLPIGAHDIITTDYAAMDTHIALAALFVLIVPTYLPNLLLNYSLRIVAPTASSIYSYIQPVVAIALAVAMGLDKIHADTVLFAIIVFIGVGCVVGSYGKAPTKK